MIEIKETKPNPEVIGFINQMMKPSDREADYEVRRNLFMNGYCWHFAQMLKATFGRGEVCIAAPFGHCVWKDTDGTCYDAEGVTCSEAYYFIPEDVAERAVPGTMLDFKHIPHKYSPNNSRADLIHIMKSHCMISKEKYCDSVENIITGD